jgi:hypothetical protein
MLEYILTNYIQHPVWQEVLRLGVPIGPCMYHWYGYLPGGLRLLYYFDQFSGAVARHRNIRTLDFEDRPGHA